jgi:hypothetical protein
MKPSIFPGVSALVLFCAAGASALINPGLQPMDLYARYTDVISTSVERVNVADQTITLKITERYHGESIPNNTVTVQFGGEVAGDFDRAVGGELRPGSRVVAFVGKDNRRRRDDIMVYADGFYLGTRTDAEHWMLDKGDTALVGVDGQAVDSLMGTWNGSTEQLMEMMADVRDGRCHFPRKAYSRFKPDIVIDQFDGPVHGVALFDLDGDDDLDLYACSLTGNRLYFQVAPLKFARADETIQHTHSGVSCSIADVNADGRFDLLADHTVYLNKLDGSQFKLVPGATLPLPDGAVFKSASFVELNGDGHPDVLMSLVDGGLISFENKADESGTFGDARVIAKTGNGYFAPGDWNDDGRTDLFYSIGKGQLLIQHLDGAFQPLEHDFGLDFLSGPNREPGLTGAGTFMPLFNDRRLGLVIPGESNWTVIKNSDAGPVDVTEYGNEISEGSFMHLATIPVDLNMDGAVDIYTVSREPNGHNRFIINRGYGSFMLASVHKSGPYMFQGPAEEHGGLGVTSGDVDGDGAPDLLIGNPGGMLSLILNDTLSMRVPMEFPTDDIKNLLNMRVVSVRVAGLTGVTGAKVTIEDATGRVLGHRLVGTAVATGCAEPRTFSFTVPMPGTYQVKVRFSDGLESTFPADLTSEPRVLVLAERDDEF